MYPTQHQKQDNPLQSWCDETPLGFADGPNKYQYAGNDPVNFRDPTGLSQAGHPLNNLAGGFSGNLISEPISFNSTLTHNTTIGRSILDFGGPSQFSPTPNPFLSTAINTLSTPVNSSSTALNNFVSTGIQNVGNFIGQASNNFGSVVNSGVGGFVSAITPAAPQRIKPPLAIQQFPNDENSIPGTVAIPNAIRLNFGGPDKNEIRKGLTQLKSPLRLDSNFPEKPGEFVSARVGEHFVVPLSRLGPNDLVGTQGADPCVGVIICEHTGPSSRAMVFHFNPTQNPVPAITQFKDSFKPGPGRTQPEVFIFGGNNSPTSNNLLQGVVDAFTKPNFQIGAQSRIRVIDTQGLFIDQNGVPRLFKGTGNSVDEGNKGP